MMVQDGTTLEQRVDHMLAKSNSNPAPAPQPRVNRDNSRNYGRPPFQFNPQSKRDYRQSPGPPQLDIKQNLRGPSLVLLVLLEKLTFLDQFNASNVGDGVIPKDFAHHI